MRKLFIAVIVMAFGVSLTAQERASGDIEVAPYIAYSSAFFNGDNSDAYDFRTGLAFGVKGDYYLNDRWSIRSGISYDPMGASLNGSGQDVELNYISIPLNANWHFGSTRKWNLNFGLTPSFLTKAELEGFGDIKDQVKSFSLGISYGIGYKIEVSDNFSVLIDAQGNLGVTDINNIEESTIKQNNAFSYLGVGGVFKI